MPGPFTSSSVEAFDHMLAAAGRFLREHAQDTEVLVVGHTRLATEDFLRGCCGPALIGAHALSLRELAGVLAKRSLLSRGSVMVSNLAREALAARVVARSRPIGYFEPVAGMPGFPRALAATLDELRMEGITPAQLSASAPDLGRLLEAFARELEEASAADSAAIYASATEVLRRGGHPLCGLPVALAAPAIERGIEGDFVDALIAQSPHVFVGELTPEPGSQNAGSALASLQRFLFSPDEPAPQTDDSVEMFSASGEALECVEMARRIAHSGRAFDEIAILLRDPGRYAALVEEALRRAGIPAFFARGTERPEPAGRAFLALLACAAEDFSAARFAEYLSLRQFPESEEAPVSGSRWERLLNDAGVIGGKARWERRLRGLAQELRFRGTEDEEAEDRAREEAAQLDLLLRFALPLLDRLEALPRRGSWGEWLEALDGLAAQALSKPEAVQEVLEELATLADLGPVDLGDVLRVLGQSLGSVRRPQRGSRYGRVFVAPIEDARGMSFQLVFVPGLSEGGFPKPVREDPLLLDGSRRAISPQLRTSLDRREQTLLRIAAAAARERFVLSYPRIDPLTGRERVPSLYAYDALRAARGAAFRPRELQAEARAHSQTTLAWPSPHRPEDAIDDAEFDLAFLRPLMDAPQDGAAAYLAKVNRHLLGALRARGRRWRGAWRSPDGLVDLDIEALEMLAAHRLPDRAYSASALQQFAVCPYRFALQAIYGLRPLERPAPLQRMDAALRGEIFHRIQFELLRALQSSQLLPVNIASLENAYARLEEVVRRVGAEFAERFAPAIPRVWAAELESMRVDLRGWLAEGARVSPDWTPVAFELSFGMEPDIEHDARSTPEAVACDEGVLLRGSIDLVERHTSGVLRVTDHKTGRPPSPAPLAVGKGELLQPLLYASAAEKLLRQKVGFGRLFYATLRANYQAYPIAVNEATRNRLAHVLKVIDDAIYKGFLPAAPRKDACKHCDYRPVCGPYEEERVARKSQAELQALKELRGQG